MVPYRVVPRYLRVVRTAIRWLRIRRVAFLCRGEVRVERDFSIGRRSTVLAPDHFFAADRVGIGSDFHCESNARIGSDVLISSRVAFISNDHDFSDPDLSVFQGARLPAAEIIIEGDTLIGFGTTIVAPARVGRGAIVGAGSLVVGDLPGGHVYVGRPAKPIRPRWKSADG